MVQIRLRAQRVWGYSYGIRKQTHVEHN